MFGARSARISLALTSKRGSARATATSGAARKKLLAGDYFIVDYRPGVGTVIVVNGKPETDAIKEPEFFSSMMKIWLGHAPADVQLKDALLGKAPAPRDPFNN